MDGARDFYKTMRELSDSEWQERIEEIAETEGYFEPLGEDHFAMFADEGAVLLVTFETRESIRRLRENQLPLGASVARANGWSSLTLVCNRDTWFRDPRVFAYFDRLVDDAFFEDFDKVVFYGSGPCGYAAAAFSVAAPGATVLAMSPQATLDPKLAGWDDRFRQMRRTSFEDRYGFAPDMMEGVGEGYILFDPFEPLDAMHAALFARPGVTLLPCRNMGNQIEDIFAFTQQLEPLLCDAVNGAFTEKGFWKMYRERRNSPRYLRRLGYALQDRGRTVLEAILCRNVVERLKGPRFLQRFERLETHLKDQGITLPPPRAAQRAQRVG